MPGGECRPHVCRHYPLGQRVSGIGRASSATQRGFTLIELMVALAVAGVLVAVGLPSFRELMATQRAKSAASELHLSLLMARSESIKRSTNVELVHNGTGWTDGWVVRVDPAATFQGGAVLRTNDALESVTLVCSTDSDSATETCPASVTFSRTGRPTSFIEFRTYVSGEDTVTPRCVSMSLSGRPRVVLDSDSDPANGCD